MDKNILTSKLTTLIESVFISIFRDKVPFQSKLKLLFKAIEVTAFGWTHFYSNIPKSAIIISICDGMGNQLFKYSFAWAVANRLSKKLAIDTFFFKFDLLDKRTYKLGELGIEADRVEFAHQLNIDEYCCFFHYMRILNRLLPYSMRIYVNERDVKEMRYYEYSAKVYVDSREPEKMNFEEVLKKFSRRKCVYFDGYWENINYIEYARSTIQAQILESLKLSDTANVWLEKIQSKVAVAIHVRRLRFPYVLQPSYYRKAYASIETIIPDAKFYIFADDWQWVAENLSFISSAELVKGNSDIDDFYLLLSSKNSILANSTFSWWSAYLKPDRDATIIAPKLIGKKFELLSTWIPIEECPDE